MKDSLSEVVIPMDKISDYHWKTWAKAGLVFAATVAAFCAAKTYGSFDIANSWVKRFKASYPEDGLELFHDDKSVEKLSLQPVDEFVAIENSIKSRLTEFDELAIATNNVKFVGRNLLQTSDSSEVNAPPVLVNNELTIKVGESKVLTSAELSATDIDTANNTLVFTASEPQHGEFRYANGTSVISWTQQELISGSIRFSHDSSFIAPTYSVKVSDGISDTECNRPIVSFAAENIPITDEFQVNTYTMSNQLYSSVASFSDGRFIVTWDSDQQDGHLDGIYGQLFTKDVAKSGLEFQVNTHTTNNQAKPSVASFTDGRFVVTWHSYGQDGGDSGVYGQLFNVDGSKNGLEFRVNTYTTSYQSNPSVVSLPDGRFVVTWISGCSPSPCSGEQDGSTYGIYGQLLNSDGTKSGSEFQINIYTTSHQMHPSVASFIDGRFVVIWMSDGQDSSGDGVYGQLFNTDSSKSGLEFQVNTYTANSQSYPSVASFIDGRFVVTWQSNGQDGDSNGIYGQLFNVDGSRNGTEFQVNTYTTSSQDNSSVTSLPDGRFVVTWGSWGQDGSDYGVYGQLFNNDATKSDSEFQVNMSTQAAQNYPSITSFSNGRFVVTWSGQDNSLYGIYGRILGPNICPFLTSNYLAIDEGAILQLDNTNFNVSDPDSNYNSTLYTFTDIQYGQFELIAIPGTNITSCTQQQITAGEIQFVHDGGEQAPACQVMVSDGILSTSFIPAIIYFTNVNDAPILGNNTLSINEDETVIPTTTNLSATDVDNDDNTLEFTVSNVQYGQFELVNNPGVPITSFTQQQIILSQVRFIHDGGEIAPSYDVVVSDGDLATTPESSVIAFTNVNDMPLLINNTLSITTGQTLRLSPTNLSATDSDNDANTLEFTVSDVQHGQFELFVRPGMAILSFTQQQINDGDICFVHDGSLDAPQYKVSVSDGELTTPPSVASINFVDISASSSADSRDSSVSSAMVNSLQSSSETRKSELSSEISSFTPMSSNSIVKPSSLVSIPSSVNLPLSDSLESTLKDNTLVIILAIVFGSGGALTCAILSGLSYLWYRRSREEPELSDIELRAVRVSKHMSMLDKKGELQVSFNIPYGKLKFGKVLGGGGSGVVYQGVWQRTHVAIKKLPLAGLDDTTQREFVQETSIMANLRHPNIVQLFGVCLKPECCIVMEYMVGGSLYDFLHSDEQLEWNLKWKIALDIGQGLAYLHEENILHRDLKSLNVLLDQDKRAKLTDFGLSKVDAESIKTMTQEGQGTPRWLPPEVMETGQEGEEKSHYNKKSDVYSYGIILWELATREIPFNDIDNNFVVMQKVKQGLRPKDPADCSPTYTALMKRCWADRTLDRPDIDEVVQILETHRNEFLAGDITSQTVSMV